MVLFPRCERFVPLEEKQIALLPMLFNGKDKLTQVRFLSLPLTSPVLCGCCARSGLARITLDL